ncbi:MAG: hypothetical protein E7544_07960 [Ruminococcaceae bacterium]|nr:hypothetical protein [Oscillospiraceae bacterium]
MATFKKVLSVLLAVVMAFSVFSVAASAVTTGGTDSLATLTLDTEKLTVDPGDEIVVTAYLTTNFYAASYTIPWFYSKNIFTPVSAAYADGSPFADYAKIQYNAALNTNLVKNQFGTKTLAWTANPVLAANGLTAADITKDNFQDYFYYATCTITPNSQIGPQAAIFDNNAIVDYTFKVADDAAPGTVGVIWFDQCYGWATTNTGGIFKIACYKDGVGTVGTSTTACYTDVSSDASRLVFTVAGAEEEKADKTELEAAIATLPTVSQDIATSASWKAYTDALATAQSVFADDAATQDAVDAAKNALLTAINNVAELGFCDYTALNAAIADYEATLADKADYTADSWADYEAAYTAAKAVETNLRNDEAGVNAAKIAAATKALTDAKAALKDAPTEEPEEGEAAHIDIVTSNANPKPGDEVTIDVYLTTNFYAAATQIPVIFDSNYFSLVTTGTAYTNAVTIPTSSPFNAYARPNGNITSPARAYPSSYTTEMKAQWKMVYMQFAPSSSVGTQAAMFDNDLIFSFKLKVNEDATVGGTGLVKIDVANFEKTLTNTGGNFYVSYYADGVGEVGTTVTAYGQKHTVTDASMVITAGEVELKDADYTAVEAAKAKIPADLTIYTDDTVATLNAAVAAVVEGLKEDEQARVDKFAADIEAAITALELKPADYTVVETAKAKIPADLTIYTDDTVAVLNRAVAAVVEGLDITKQAEVNAYAAAIDTAVAGLTLKAADYTAVEAAKAKVPADLTIYANGDAVTAAVEAVVYGLDITKQADVDAMAQAIEDAIAALTLKAADYTAVEAAKAKVPADLSIYTNGDAVTAAVEAVVYGLDITKQAEVDAMAQAIEDAIAALTLKAADYTAVEAAKAKIPADLSIYDAEKVAALNAAVEAVVYGLDITKQADVDAYAAAIEAAVAALDGSVLPADYTAVEAAKAKVPADLTIYVNGDAVTAAVEAVVYGLDITKQADVDAMAQAIEDAIAALTLKAADYTAVEAAKAKVPADLTIYTNGDAVTAAVEAVVYGLDITKQADVDAMAQAIEDAIAALTLKAADYTAVEAAKAKVPADLTIYTNGDAVTAAVEAVVYGLDITKQADVDAMAQAIEDAIAALELKAADYTAVEAAKAKVPADLSIYVNGDAVTAAVEAVVYGLDITKQADVDAMAQAIEDAITALELKPADYSRIEAAKLLVPADLRFYENAEAVEAALAAVVYGLDITKQATVDAYADVIENAIAALKLKAADYTAVEAAKAKVPADLTIYTNGDAVTAAVEAVVYGLDITKQAEVDAMAQAIEDAIAALTLKTADYTAVEAAKAKVPADLTIYTNGDAVTAAVEAVVYGLDITKQADVDAMAQAIEDAIAALTLKAADYTAVEAAKAKVPADLSIYTADSIEALNKALAAVVEGLDITKQAEVDAMAKAIEDAIINLDVIGCVIISFTTSDELKSGEYADLEVLVDRPVFKLQIVRDNLTWTYTRDSEFVAITTNDDGTEKWTISHMMYETEMNLFVHARTYEFGWQDAGKYLTIETTDVLTAYSIDVAVADTAVFTVKTTTDVAKIQIIDANGNTKTLNAGYEDVDGVRVWTYERVLADGEYTYTVKVRGLNTAWADTNATTTFRVGAPTEGTIKSATTDKDYYFLGDTVTLTVVTDVAVSKIQYTDNNGNTKTLADGYVEADGVRTWTITVTPADFADYEYTFSAKTAAGWAATDVTVSFTVYY